MQINVKAAIANMRRMDDCPKRPDMSTRKSIGVCDVRIHFGAYWRVMQALRRTKVEHVEIEGHQGDLIITSLPESNLEFRYTLKGVDYV